MKLITLDKSFSELRWKTEEAYSPFPPVVADVEGVLCLLSGFGKDVEVFFAGEMSLNEALELSVNIHGEPSPAELGRMILTAEKFGADINRLSMISSRVKGKKSLEALKILACAPKAFLDYVRVKEPSMKTIGMYAALPETHKELARNYAAEKEPSVSAFRNVIEILTDYADREVSPADLDTPLVLEKERTNSRAVFEKRFTELSSSLGAAVSSPSMFETPELSFTITAKNAEEYMSKCLKLCENSEKSAELFNFLNENDIY